MLQKRGVKFLVIDTEQGDDSELAEPIEELVEERQLENEIHSTSQKTTEPIADQSASFDQEIKRAGKIHNEALGLVSSALEAAQKGQAIDTAPFEEWQQALWIR